MPVCVFMITVNEPPHSLALGRVGGKPDFLHAFLLDLLNRQA
jgi:hypothetical protein